MFPNDDEILLNGNIAIIKFVRSISSLCLADAKYLVDEWADFVGQRGIWKITRFSQLETLCKIVGKVNRGEWAIVDMKLAWGKPQPVNRSDIANL